MKDNSKKIKDIATAQVGYQARGKLNENPNGEFSILRVQDFNKFGYLITHKAARFFADKSIDPMKSLVTMGDILVQARGLKHTAFCLDLPLEKTVASNSFYIIRIKEISIINPLFLTWWINQAIIQEYFEKEQGISTIPFISISTLMNTPVVIPPAKIQKTICDLVNCWQKEQELNQKLVNKKEIFIQTAAIRAANKTQEVKYGR